MILKALHQHLTQTIQELQNWLMDEHGETAIVYNHPTITREFVKHPRISIEPTDTTTITLHLTNRGKTTTTTHDLADPKSIEQIEKLITQFIQSICWWKP